MSLQRYRQPACRVPDRRTEPKGVPTPVGMGRVGVGARRLGLAVKQLPTDPLELVLDADGHGVEVDGVRREPRTSPLRSPSMRTRT